MSTSSSTGPAVDRATTRRGCTGCARRYPPRSPRTRGTADDDRLVPLPDVPALVEGAVGARRARCSCPPAWSRPTALDTQLALFGVAVGAAHDRRRVRARRVVEVARRQRVVVGRLVPLVLAREDDRGSGVARHRRAVARGRPCRRAACTRPSPCRRCPGRCSASSRSAARRRTTRSSRACSRGRRSRCRCSCPSCRCA